MAIMPTSGVSKKTRLNCCFMLKTSLILVAALHFAMTDSTCDA